MIIFLSHNGRNLFFPVANEADPHITEGFVEKSSESLKVKRTYEFFGSSRNLPLIQLSHIATQLFSEIASNGQAPPSCMEDGIIC